MQKILHVHLLDASTLLLNSETLQNCKANTVPCIDESGEVACHAEDVWIEYLPQRTV